MQEDWIYLDYNASTPLAEEVSAVMEACLEAQAHPSSQHPHGLKASALVALAREQVARSLGCEPEEIVFGSGSTEASNHVIKGVAFSEIGKALHFVTSTVDHAATIEPLRFLEKLGHQVTWLEVDRQGLVHPSQVDEAIRPNTALVTLIHGQNEIGTVQPLADVGRVCASRKVLFHVDASQSFGKVPVDVQELQCDFLNIAGHKAYGPKGVGALFIRKGRRLEPLLHGGGHERGLRSGTPAPQLIAGLGAACQLVRDRGLISEQPAQQLWEFLSSQLNERVRRNGHPEQRLPNVVHVTFEGVDGRRLLEEARISASTGAACHSATVSPVLKALGLTPEQAAGSVRLSLGRDTDLATARRAAEALVTAYHKLRAEVTV